MNQHFIYNTLNYIQSFINRGEKEVSLAYIGKFSRLLRRWMQDATEPWVSMAQEVALLEEYLALEQMRFNWQFSFAVTSVVPKQEDVFIMPHIIFPLAEHAVGWCLKQLSPGEQTISISLVAEPPFIKCNVQAQNSSGTKTLTAGLHLLPRQP